MTATGSDDPTAGHSDARLRHTAGTPRTNTLVLAPSRWRRTRVPALPLSYTKAPLSP